MQLLIQSAFPFSLSNCFNRNRQTLSLPLSTSNGTTRPAKWVIQLENVAHPGARDSCLRVVDFYSWLSHSVNEWDKPTDRPTNQQRVARGRRPLIFIKPPHCPRTIVVLVNVVCRPQPHNYVWLIWSVNLHYCTYTHTNSHSHSLQPNTPIEPTICIALRNRNTTTTATRNSSNRQKKKKPVYELQLANTQARQSIANSALVLPSSSPPPPETLFEVACHQGKVIDVVERKRKRENWMRMKMSSHSSQSFSQSDRSRQLQNPL